MKDIQFNTINTRIRTYEEKLLHNSMYERMFAAQQAEEILTILQETPYGDFIDETTSVHEFEKLLLAEQKRVYDNLYEISPNRQVIDLFSLKYDYQNLKVFVKEVLIDKDLSSLLVPYGSVPLSTLKELVKVRHSEHVHEQMNACMQEIFQYIEGYHEHHALDIIFDNHYWQHLSAIANGNEEFQLLVRRNIDVFNISTALRSHLMGRHKGFITAVLAKGGTLSVEKLVETISSSLDDFVSYLQETPYKPLIDSSYEEIITHKTLNDFDLWKDNFLMARLKEQKIIPFGPWAMMGYIYAKEIEIKNLRILLIGKINKIPEDILRSRVRETYV